MDSQQHSPRTSDGALVEGGVSSPLMVPVVTLTANCITSARTQKPLEELSAVAGTSCALGSWQRDLARLSFATLVAVPRPCAPWHVYILRAIWRRVTS